MKKILLIFGGILGFILQIYIGFQIVLDVEYIYLNYIERGLFGKNVTQKLDLDYLGMQKVDLSDSEAFQMDYNDDSQFTYAWDISSYYDYMFFKEQIGLDNDKVAIGCKFFQEAYIVSYGRELTNATYDLDEYNDFLSSHSNYTSEFSMDGYYVDYVYDETDYHEGTIFIYRCDRIKIGNSWYRY